MHNSWLKFLYRMLRIGFIAIMGVSCSLKSQKDRVPVANVLVNDYQAQINYLENYSKKEPLNAVIYYKLAVIYMTVDNTEKAYSNSYKAWDLDKNNSKYALLLTQCYMKKGLYLDALDYFNKIKESEVPANEYVSLAAEVYFQNKDIQKALNYLERAAIEVENKAFIWYKKGLLYEWTQNTPMALECFKIAFYLDSAYTLPALKIADIYSDSLVSDSAIKYYQATIKRDSTLFAPYSKLAHYYFDSQKQDSAAMFYRKCIQIDSAQTDAYFKLSNMALANKKYEEAAQYLYSALKFHADSSQVYVKLAVLNEKRLKPEIALQYYAKVDSSHNSFNFAAEKIIFIKQTLRARRKASAVSDSSGDK